MTFPDIGFPDWSRRVEMAPSLLEDTGEVTYTGSRSGPVHNVEQFASVSLYVDTEGGSDQQITLAQFSDRDGTDLIGGNIFFMRAEAFLMATVPLVGRSIQLSADAATGSTQASILYRMISSIRPTEPRIQVSVRSLLHLVSESVPANTTEEHDISRPYQGPATVMVMTDSTDWSVTLKGFDHTGSNVGFPLIAKETGENPLVRTIQLPPWIITAQLSNNDGGARHFWVSVTPLFL